MISGWNPRVVTWLGALMGALTLLFILPNLALWIILGLAVGVIVYSFVELVRDHDERQQKRTQNSVNRLQTTHEWDRFVAARKQYDQDIEAWMDSDELIARRGF